MTDQPEIDEQVRKLVAPRRPGLEKLVNQAWAPLLCFALAAAIGLAAIADHRNKNSRMDKAEVKEWYCVHQGTQCSGPSSARIEAHWNERQLGYEIAVSALSGVAILLFVSRTLRR